ncbi:MAG: tetratricopeptide repeat-containing protein, partial [Parvularculaceae bacterium]
LSRPARTLAVQRGAVIAPPKGKLPEIYVLESGVVAKLAAELDGGRSVLVGLFGAGDAIALDTAFREKPHERASDSARELRAITNVTAAAIPIEDFRRILRRSHELSDAVIGTLSIRQSRLEARFALALQSPLEMRLASFFSQLAAMVAGNRWEPTAMIGKLSQSFTADMLGVSREHVNRTLAMWEKSGLIFQNKAGDITVENRKRLMQIAGERRAARAPTPDGDALWEIDAHLDYGLNHVAYDLAQEALRRAPRDDRFKHRAALALARTGAVEEALALIDSFQIAEKSTDEDVLCLGPRLRRDLALRTNAAPDAALLRKAAEEFEKVFAKTGGYYPGVNAAASYAMAGDTGRAKPFAEKVAGLCKALLDETDDDEATYYQRATLGEALLLMGDRAEATRAFAAVRSTPDFTPGKASTTRKQLRRLSAPLRLDEGWIERALPQRANLYFSGPLAFEDDGNARHQSLVDAIDAFLERTDIASAFGALAAGADIIIAERLLKAGIALNIQLPLAPDAFLARSVAPYGDGWRQRFIACIEAAQTVDWNRSTRIGPAAYRLGSRVSMGKAIGQARTLDAAVHGFFAVRRIDAEQGSVSLENAQHWRDLGLATELVTLDWAKPAAAKDDNPSGRVFAALTLAGAGAPAVPIAGHAFTADAAGCAIFAFDEPREAIAAARALAATAQGSGLRLWLDAGVAVEGSRHAFAATLVTASCRPETAPGRIYASEVFADMAMATAAPPEFVYVGHSSLEEKLFPCPLYLLHS